MKNKIIIVIICLFFYPSCIKISNSRTKNMTEAERRQQLYQSNIINYLRAKNLEKQWENNAKIKTKEDLEKIVLKLSIVREIDPKNSMWGYDYKLKNNEKMIQYLLYKTEPLDVVYDDKNNILAIYTSYE